MQVSIATDSTFPMSLQKRQPILPVDIIYPIVDILSVDFDIENLDLFVRSQRRLRREFYSKELLNLRVVSRTFCRIVSPRLFHTLRLTHTLPSIRGFLSIIQSPWVRHCVQAVRYEYWNPGKHRRIITALFFSDRMGSIPFRSQNLNGTKSSIPLSFRSVPMARRFDRW